MTQPLTEETKQAIQRGMAFLEEKDAAPWLDLPPEMTDALTHDLNAVQHDPIAPYREAPDVERPTP